MTEPTLIRVRSHVGRDLLQAAAHFKTEASVVWEYVVNSLQYVDRSVSPQVDVRTNQKRKEIVICDNGRGMDKAGLENYFYMHAENIDRRQGQLGRGKFGTGKSAAFGIATSLRVDSIRAGLRNVVELRREDIDQSHGEEIPLRVLSDNEPASGPNGTTITISGIVLQQLDVAAIKSYIERHLVHFRNCSPLVVVDSHPCEIREPVVKAEYKFKPTPEQAAALGEIELIIRVSQAPLPETEQGVSVTAGPGNLVAVEKCGMEKKECGAYLLGDVNVPHLEDPSSPIEPYDPSRNLTLNPRHPIAAVLIGFIGARLEQVRAGIVDELREARKTEEARRLALESQRIADVLNEDFRALRAKLRDIQAVAKGREVAPRAFGNGDETGNEEDQWVKGIDVPGEIPKTGRGREGAGPKGREAPNLPATGQPQESGPDLVSPASGRGHRRRPAGGFRVDFRELGPDEHRSMYVPEEMTILVNLDHPVVRAAIGQRGTEDPVFKRLCYEIAFSEYAMALGYELVKFDPYIQPDDLLYEVRTTLNRVSRSAASLYH